MSLHITGGEFRNRKLDSVSGNSARPTSSFVRNAMFNILGDKVTDASVVDFFCAGGTIGLEAISRGASSCCFVENGGKAVSALRSNIEKLDVSEQCYTISMNALSSIRILEDKGAKFDLLFADPPYKKPLAIPLLTKLRNSSILKEDAILILEAASRDEIKFPEWINILKTWVSGDTALYFISFDNH